MTQGSILGRLVYIYTMTVCSGLEYCNSHIYADDTQLYQSFNKNSVDDKVNSDLNIIENILFFKLQ